MSHHDQIDLGEQQLIRIFFTQTLTLKYFLVIVINNWT